jgi:hypothetical protein
MVRDKLTIDDTFNEVFGEGGPKSPEPTKRAPRWVRHELTSDPVLSERSSRRKQGEATPFVFALSQTTPLTHQPNPAPYARSYEYFRQMTISDAAGFADRQFWDASKQLSHKNEAVFHALTSLGALHESLMSPNEASRQESHRASLIHCNKAIRLVLDQSKVMSTPLILVTCVIFATIQVFADAPMASKTLHSGGRLLDLAQRQASRLSSSERAVLDLVALMFVRYRSRITLVLLPTTVVTDHLNSLTGATDPVPKVPSTFDSLLQAREILQAICDWSFHAAKSQDSLEITDKLQKDWVQALAKLSSASLHPLSLRSLNLLKIARLASACLISAQFMTQQHDFDEYFPSFKHVLNLHGDSFRLCRSTSIFTTVFDFNASILDILDLVSKRSTLETLKWEADAVLQVHHARHQHSDGRATNEEGSLPQMSSESSANNHSLRISSLDFFAQSGLARLRLKPVLDHNGIDTVERWFSILDSAPEPRFLSQEEIASETVFRAGDTPNAWTESIQVRGYA